MRNQMKRARMLGAVSSMVMRLSASIIPTRKTMEERCPSPVARRLIKKRVHPGGVNAGLKFPKSAG